MLSSDSSPKRTEGMHYIFNYYAYAVPVEFFLPAGICAAPHKRENSFTRFSLIQFISGSKGLQK